MYRYYAQLIIDKSKRRTGPCDQLPLLAWRVQKCKPCPVPQAQVGIDDVKLLYVQSPEYNIGGMLFPSVGRSIPSSFPQVVHISHVCLCARLCVFV